MNHDQCRDLLSDYLDHALPPALLQELGAHLRECALCARTASRLEAALLDLRSFPRLDVPADFTFRVLEKTTHRSPAAGSWEFFRYVFGLPRLSPAAAALLLALPLLFLAGTRDGRQLSREINMAGHRAYSDAIRLVARKSDLRETAASVGKRIPGQLEEGVDWFRQRLGSGETAKPKPRPGEPNQRSFRSLERSPSA